MYRPRIVSPILIASLLCAPVAAQTAQPPGPPTDGQATASPVVDLDAAEARKAFEEGVLAYQNGDYKLAADRFGQAQLLKPHPEVLLNLAQSQLKAEQFAEAATNFQGYLTQTQRDNATARTGLADAKTQVAEVAVLAPEGNQVLVDQTAIGTAPLPQAMYLVPGRHEVVSGERSETIEVTAGQSTTVDLLSDGNAKPEAVAAVPEGNNAAPRMRVDKWFMQRPGAWVGAGITAGSLLFSAIAATTAGRRYDAANDAKRQILEHYSAEPKPNPGGPCAPPTLSSAYDYACAFYVDRADSGDAWRTASIVTLVVGLLAAGGTVTYYYLDPENHEGQEPAPAAIDIDADPTLGRYTLSLTGSF